MDIQGHVERFSTEISVISWKFLKPFTLDIGLISSYKVPAHFVILSDEFNWNWILHTGCTG